MRLSRRPTIALMMRLAWRTTRVESRSGTRGEQPAHGMRSTCRRDIGANGTHLPQHHSRARDVSASGLLWAGSACRGYPSRWRTRLDDHPIDPERADVGSEI